MVLQGLCDEKVGQDLHIADPVDQGTDAGRVKAAKKLVGEPGIFYLELLADIRPVEQAVELHFG